MTRWERMKKSGMESAESHGHSMKRYHRDGYWLNTWIAECRECGMTVYACKNPMPNETNVFGPAVAVDCDHAFPRMKGGRA